jgi:glucose-1-phosphate cytidylyltransferase
MAYNYNNFDCLILCGGKGTRLGTLGRKKPKSLFKFNNSTLLDYLIQNLSKYNVNKITLSCHYKFNHFIRYLNKMNYKKKIKCVDDGNVSILERIKINLFKTQKQLLVCYADEIANINISRLLKHHLKSKKLMTITTYKFFSNFGFLFKNNENNFIFNEKPYLGNYNIGYYFINPNTKKLIVRKKKIENFINLLANRKELNEFVHNGKHITYNTIEEYQYAKNLKL